jgi:hypothetical protein
MPLLPSLAGSFVSLVSFNHLTGEWGLPGCVSIISLVLGIMYYCLVPMMDVTAPGPGCLRHQKQLRKCGFNGQREVGVKKKENLLLKGKNLLPGGN